MNSVKSKPCRSIPNLGQTARSEGILSERSHSKAAVFVLSLDCEGLWGMADSEKTMSSGIITSAALTDAYRFLDRTLDRAGIRATAAFVSAFASERDAVQAVLPDLKNLAELQPDWFRLLLPRLQAADATSLDGLEGHQFWKMLAAAGHEMGWHGSTHMPLTEKTSGEAVDIELLLARHFGNALGQFPRSVVFPRNRIGHLGRIKAAGFETYRESRADSRGLTMKLSSLAREYMVWDKGDDAVPRTSNGWAVSPAGHFLNWPSKIRAMVPIGVTIRRWQSMLRHAAKHGKCVHMWFHPHNLITAPAMRIAFTAIMDEVRTLEAAGDIISLTMADASRHYNVGR